MLFILVGLNLVLLFKLSGRNDESEMRERLDKSLAPLKKEIQEEIRSNRQEIAGSQNELKNFLSSRLAENDQKQIIQMKNFSDQFSGMIKSVDERMTELRDNNAKKLDQMREVVDEKLQKTLDTRFKNAFDSVGDKLEKMYKNLGEINKLSDGVTSLNRVLSNVKTRGILGEHQLENILQEMLSLNQFAKNKVMKKNSNERVDFAIKLPGNKENNEPLWLPIDSKFPLESYEKYKLAYEENDFDKDKIKKLKKEIFQSIKIFAKEISSKYINPPLTTDFAIMFLPIEGLYGEVLGDVALVEELRRDFKIVVVGPNILAAFLNILQIGFKTLAIQKKTTIVWDLLNEFKKDFNKFGDLLQKTQKKIQEAGNVIDHASKRTRIIDKKLQKIEDPFISKKETLTIKEETFSGLIGNN